MSDAGDRRLAERLDQALVRRGLAPSRAQAQAAILAGGVEVEGRAVLHPGERVAADAVIVFTPAHPYVSRGGVKLAHALSVFGVDPAGRACLDIGASTGGFTDVLLRAGARLVVAVDVGRGQLHPRIAADPRVRSLEGMDARRIDAGALAEAPSLIVCDASFISLVKVLPAPLALAAPACDLVALFKPQFEVGPEWIGRGGRVRSDAPVDAARDRVGVWLAAEGWTLRAWVDSPINGGAGAREHLLHAAKNV